MTSPGDLLTAELAELARIAGLAGLSYDSDHVPSKYNGKGYIVLLLHRRLFTFGSFRACDLPGDSVEVYSVRLSKTERGYII
jgi:hypothetical protein